MEHGPDLGKLVGVPASHALLEQLDRSQRELLAAFADLLRQYSKRLDLVSPRDLDRLEGRHVLDSLKALPLALRLAPGVACDVGSGAGFPGVALAISDPRHRWRLLEPRRKRAAFLEEVARELSLDYEVVRMRAEEAARDPRYAHKHGLVTARAVAPPAVAFRLTRPLVARGGIACVFVGKGDALPEGAEAAGSGLAIIRG